MVGGPFITVIKTVQKVTFSDESSTVIMKGSEGMGGRGSPGGSDCRIVTGPHKSVGTTWEVKSGIGAPQPRSLAVRVTSLGGQVVMTGGLVSSTVVLTVQVATFPASSLTVTAIGCGPSPTSVPALGTCDTVTGPQVSLAISRPVTLGRGA